MKNILNISIDNAFDILWTMQDSIEMKVLQGLAQKYGHTVLPFPPYSPELNPIEKTWGNIKKYLRKTLPNFTSFGDALVSYYGFN